MVALGLLAASAIGVAGCGGSSDLSAMGQSALMPYVEHVRSAAAGTSTSALKSAVTKLKHEVAVEENKHHLSTERGNQIENAATRLVNDYITTATATPSSTPASSTPASSPSSQETPPPSATPPSAPATTVTPKKTATVTITPSSGSHSSSDSASP
jgi:hypothetical protein